MKKKYFCFYEVVNVDNVCKCIGFVASVFVKCKKVNLDIWRLMFKLSNDLPAFADSLP